MDDRKQESRRDNRMAFIGVFAVVAVSIVAVGWYVVAQPKVETTAKQ